MDLGIKNTSNPKKITRGFSRGDDAMHEMSGYQNAILGFTNSLVWTPMVVASIEFECVF